MVFGKASMISFNEAPLSLSGNIVCVLERLVYSYIKDDSHNHLPTYLLILRGGLCTGKGLLSFVCQTEPTPSMTTNQKAAR